MNYEFITKLIQKLEFVVLGDMADNVTDSKLSLIGLIDDVNTTLEIKEILKTKDIEALTIIIYNTLKSWESKYNISVSSCESLESGLIRSVIVDYFN